MAPKAHAGPKTIRLKGQRALEPKDSKALRQKGPIVPKAHGTPRFGLERPEDEKATVPRALQRPADAETPEDSKNKKDQRPKGPQQSKGLRPKVNGNDPGPQQSRKTREGTKAKWHEGPNAQKAQTL